MKRESSYNFANSGKQQAALLRSAVLVLSFITVAQSLCWDNSQCPGDQVCIIDKTRKKSSSLEVEPSENSSDFKAKVRPPWNYRAIDCHNLFTIHISDFRELRLPRKLRFVEVALLQIRRQPWRFLRREPSVSRRPILQPPF